MTEYLTLGEVCTKGSSNIAQKELDGNEGEYEIYGASGLIKKVNFFHQDKPYIAVVKDGAGVGRTMLLPAKSSVIGTMQYIIPCDNVDIEYLYYAITYMDLSRYYMGAAIPHIYFKDYKKEKLPVPDIDTQKRIAAKFRLVDKLITFRQSQLSKLSELTASRFLELFGDPVLNPMGWEQTTLKDIAIGKLTYGSGASATQYDGTLRYIRITDITDNGNLNDDIKSPDRFDEKYLLHTGDVLFARSGATVGKSFCYDEKKHGKAIFAGYLIRMIPDTKKVLPIYVFHYTKTEYYMGFVTSSQRAVAQPNINAQEYGDLIICVPPLDLQTQFAAFVTQTDKSKLAVQKSLEQLETLKKSLMQKYFG